MTQAKHTSGLWTAKSSNIVAGTHIIVCQINTPFECANFAEADAERNANARLIAAAPELLEALERMIRVAGIEFDRSRPDVMEQARAAITKATRE